MNVASTYTHTPVLLQQALRGLQLTKSNIVADLTFGFGGHSKEILKSIGKNGTLYAFDRDPEMIELGKKRFQDYSIEWVQDSFSKVDEYIPRNSLNALLADFGVSSYHFENANRGFSFDNDGPLDMRLNPQKQTLSAADIVNTFSQEELTQILKTYGEEKLSKKISKEIKLYTKTKTIKTTRELADIITDCYPSNTKTKPAARTFQALRIFVNEELGEIARMLDKLPNVLASGGICAFITFHSLEDRIVKHYFQKETKDCICDKTLPVCVCGHKAVFRAITRKPITPEDEEIRNNRRARSAKLRIYQKI